MEITKKISLVLFLCFLTLNSCKKNNQEKIIIKNYNYKIYNETNHIGFEKLKVFKEGNKRIDSTFRYSKEMIIQDTTVVRYNVNSLGLYTSDSDYYLDISKDTCYAYKSNIQENYLMCYEGIENITIGNKSHEAYKFSVLETYGEYSSHSMKTKRYYDKNFILLRNELVEGYRRYFRVDRTN